MYSVVLRVLYSFKANWNELARRDCCVYFYSFDFSVYFIIQSNLHSPLDDINNADINYPEIRLGCSSI